jgi:hypothetical protein
MVQTYTTYVTTWGTDPLVQIQDMISKSVLTTNTIWKSRLVNVGVINLNDAISYSASGPIVRSVGIKKDIRFNDSSGNALSGDEYDKSANNLLEKFKIFSGLVQKYNQECGIYSGRKNGKLVGLRLAFVSDEVNLLFSSKIKEIDFDQSKKINLTAKAILSARRNKESLKQNHTEFLSKNPRLKNKIESTRMEPRIGSR